MQENFGEKSNSEESTFEEKKTEFFSKIALRNKDAVRAQKNGGLLDWDNESDRSWRNVSEHCLVEAARAEVFADKLGFSEDFKKDLVTAALAHDAIPV